MKQFTKEEVYKFLYDNYNLEQVENASRKSIYANNLQKLVDELFDLSKPIMKGFTENQTIIIRKRFGVFNGGTYKNPLEIAEEMGATRQNINMHLRLIMKKKIPIALYEIKPIKSMDFSLSKEEDKILSIPIDEMGLSPKVYNSLSIAGILRMKDLVGLSIIDLNKIPFLGKKRRDELIDKVHSYGLKFVDEIDKEHAETLLKNLEGDSIHKQMNLNEFLQLPIEIMDLPLRTYNCLKREGINTLEELVSLSTDQLLNISSLGKKGLNDLIAKLHNYGLKCSDEEKWEQITSRLKNIGENEEQKQKLQGFLQLPIEAIGLSIRTINSLKKEGIDNIQQLISLSIIDLMDMRSLGEKGLDKIVRKISDYEDLLDNACNQNESITKEASSDLSLEQLAQRRNELVARYRQLSNERKALLQQEAQINREMKEIIIELNSNGKGAYNGQTEKSQTKTIGRINSSGRNNK